MPRSVMAPVRVFRTAAFRTPRLRPPFYQGERNLHSSRYVLLQPRADRGRAGSPYSYSYNTTSTSTTSSLPICNAPSSLQQVLQLPRHQAAIAPSCFLSRRWSTSSASSPSNEHQQDSGEDNLVSRDVMEYDIVIVGGGPAGLGAAIRAKQVQPELSVCLIDKGAEIGSHILSGNVFQPTALEELLPDWRERGAPLDTPVESEAFFFLLNDSRSVRLPNVFLPKEQHNVGNYVISLGALCRWLGEQAEDLGVEIFPGFAGDKLVYSTNSEGDVDGRARSGSGKKGGVVGVRLKDVGIAKDGEKKDTFEPGMELHGRQVILAEGCRGSLTLEAISEFGLGENSCPQHYGLGLKEVWEVDNEHFSPGFVAHSVGWPLDRHTYGGSFMYHMAPNQIHIGFVVGLDYKNPHLSPYQEFQRFTEKQGFEDQIKHHPRIAKYLEGGNCVSYGARCINEGGLQAVPKLTFPGGVLAGCSAGFLNVPKIKGSHTALKTGALAGEEVANFLAKEAAENDAENMERKSPAEVVAYEDAVKNSWVWDELNVVRNCQPSFKHGLYGGLIYSAFSLHLTRGREPWTFTWGKKDHEYTKPAATQEEISYPKPDGRLSFDILDNLVRSGVKHDHDQPAHLRVKPEQRETPVGVSLGIFAGPEQRFCPAKVYEYVDGADGRKKLQINAQNCVHCKCCSIKTPDEYIQWTVPEGGGGPQYAGM